MAYVPLIQKTARSGGDWFVCAEIREAQHVFPTLQQRARVVYCRKDGLKSRWTDEEVKTLYDYGPEIRMGIALREAAMLEELEQPIATD